MPALIDNVYITDVNGNYLCNNQGSLDITTTPTQDCQISIEQNEHTATQYQLKCGTRYLSNNRGSSGNDILWKDKSSDLNQTTDSNGDPSPSDSTINFRKNTYKWGFIPSSDTTGYKIVGSADMHLNIFAGSLVGSGPGDADPSVVGVTWYIIRSLPTNKGPTDESCFTPTGYRCSPTNNPDFISSTTDVALRGECATKCYNNLECQSWHYFTDPDNNNKTCSLYKSVCEKPTINYPYNDQFQSNVASKWNGLCDAERAVNATTTTSTTPAPTTSTSTLNPASTTTASTTIASTTTASTTTASTTTASTTTVSTETETETDEKEFFEEDWFILVAIGVVVVVGGLILFLAYKKKWFPFRVTKKLTNTNPPDLSQL